MSLMEMEGVESQRDIGRLWSQHRHACLAVVRGEGKPVDGGEARCGDVRGESMFGCCWWVREYSP